MIKQLKKTGRLNESIFLVTMSVICFGLSMFRCWLTSSKVFVFLNWNLFLASIPWWITTFFILKPKLGKGPFSIILIFLIWLLFFPNAPYILTDLFHLRFRTAMPVWFDLVLILSFAWTGILFGLLSLWDIEKIINQKISTTATSVFITLLLFASSFGIYIGRYLRWNSWDIISNPWGLTYDLIDRIIHPFNHPRTWGMTFFMGIFLNMLYWSFKYLGKKRNILNSNPIISS